MNLILRWIINAIALIVIARFIDGIVISGWYAAFITALVLGLVNALIRPLLILLTLPINILTLGLFILIINALLFWFVGTVVENFEVTGFWPAFWGALIMSLVSWLTSMALKEAREQ